jgi:hypothetical protein
MRPNRLAARAAQWIEAISMRQDDFDAPELIELKDHPMPLFASGSSAWMPK